MDPAIRQALATDLVVDITTTGRKSGEPRRIEIWIHEVEGTVFITGDPGARDWYANLLADPAIIVHLKRSLRADLPGRATPITDPVRKAELLRGANPTLRNYMGEAQLLDWVANSPMVEVTLDP